jgi:hypothetical protein
MKDYAGLSSEKIAAANKYNNGQREYDESPELAEPAEQELLISVAS